MEGEADSVAIKVMSCKDLKAPFNNFFQKLNVYVIASIFEQDLNNNNKKQQQKKKTPIDREGDGNPEWNHEMRFDLKQISEDRLHRLFLEFSLLSEGTILGDKIIGKVRVPLEDLIKDCSGGGGAVRFVSYQVRTVDGIAANGVLNFSYSVVMSDNGRKKTKIDDDNNQQLLWNSSSSSSSSVLYPPPPLPELHYPPLEITRPPSSGIYYPPIEMDSPNPGIVGYPPLPQVHYPPPPHEEAQGHYYNSYYYPPQPPSPAQQPQVDPYRVNYGYPDPYYHVLPVHMI